MDAYDKLYTIHFSRPRDYLRQASDGRLYEVVRVPQFSLDLASLKSPFLHEIARTFEENGSVYCAVPFDLARNLEYILLKNSPLEEAYIASIIRSVAELVAHLHSKGLSGASFASSNFSVNPGGKLVLRNRFTLGGPTNREAEDWLNFCAFIRKVTPSLPPEDKNSSMSRNFRLFLTRLEQLGTSGGTVSVKLANLLGAKFLHQMSNFLDDLVFEVQSESDADLRKLIPFQVAALEDPGRLESSANPMNLSGEREHSSRNAEDLKRQELLMRAISTVFEKYRHEEGIRGKPVPTNLLTAIENGLKTMEVAAPFSSLPLIQGLAKPLNV